MAIYTVGAPGTLETVLGLHGVQPWRVPFLIACNDVEVKRKGALIDLKIDGAATPLRRDDIVTLDDPPPQPCSLAAAVITRLPSMYRDYAMTGPAVPNDPHIPRLARLFQLKPQTQLLQPPGNTIKEFIEMLAGDAAVTAPVRDLLLGTHATRSGAVATRAAPGDRQSNLPFERLEEAVAQRTLIVPAHLVKPRPKESGADVPPRFVIRGCAVGEAVPWLRQLKLALGGGLQVVAPKYEHALGSFAGPAGEGLYEFLAYEFDLYRPKPLATAADIVTAFIAAGYVGYDQQPIPNQVWAQWVPKGSPPQPWSSHLKFWSAFANRDLTALASFSTWEERFIDHPVKVPAQTDPVTDAERRKALEAHLGARENFKTTHPWPAYVRLGYSSVAKLVSGFTWTYKHDASVLECRGTRQVYTVHQPMVDAAGRLIHNFYPIRPAGPTKDMFTDRDLRFFAAV